jgi:hypothetical protein
MSSLGEADHEQNFDYFGQSTPPDGGWSFADRGRGRGDYHVGLGYSHELDDLYCTFSSRDKVPPWGIRSGNNARKQEEPRSSTAFVHPERMTLVVPAHELYPPTRSQLRNEVIFTADIKRK